LVEVHTCSFRTTRGYSCPAILCDETAFWTASDTAAEPDAEVLAALRPTQSMFPDRLLLAGSTPYGSRGALYETWRRYYGREDDAVLVWVGTSAEMNDTLDPKVVQRAYETDPLSAAAEYGAEFRRDVEGFITPEALAAVVVTGRLELPPGRLRYQAFVDPSGGSRDSFTLAIAHAEEEKGVLDMVRERRPPFSPDAVVSEMADALRSYGLSEVVGDHYAGEWPRERFRKHGITYRPSERSRSEIYLTLLPLLNSGRLELLDHPVLRNQLIQLERRTAISGKDAVNHPPGGRDDVANAAAGALVAVARTPSTWTRISLPDAGRREQDPLLGRSRPGAARIPWFSHQPQE
jgi:hypothetical protein